MLLERVRSCYELIYKNSRSKLGLAHYFWPVSPTNFEVIEHSAAYSFATGCHHMRAQNAGVEVYK